MNNETLPEYVRRLRTSKKMTLAVMAERLGVTTSTISAYENGTRTPSLVALVKIARLFNVTTDSLLGLSCRDMIDVSGLSSTQRDNIQNQILTYLKFNEAVYFMTNDRADVQVDTQLQTSLEQFKAMLKERK